MFILYILLLILISIYTRDYESIYKIKDSLSDKIHDIIIKFDIFGTNNYLYKFESKSLFYKFKYYIISDKSKDIEYCSMYTYGHSLFTNSVILKPNDFMIAEPNLNTNDKIACASGIHFFKTEEEVYNYLLFLNK